MKLMLHTFTAIGLALALTACGGGGGNDDSTPVVVEQKPKKKRGRPKKNTVSNTIVEAVVEQFKDENKTEESNVLKVEEIEYKGKTYYLDINNNDIYDPESSELVGKREQGKINIKC